jgi:hypothetical protein
LVGWPSDFESWGRLLDWLLPLAPSLPPRLFPHVLEVFSVWQNTFAEFRNDRSAKIVEVASSWLVDLESVEYPEKLTFEDGRWEGLGGEARKSLANFAARDRHAICPCLSRSSDGPLRARGYKQAHASRGL